MRGEGYLDDVTSDPHIRNQNNTQYFRKPWIRGANNETQQCKSSPLEVSPAVQMIKVQQDKREVSVVIPVSMKHLEIEKCSHTSVTLW